MRAPLHNGSLIQHNDLVAVPDGAQPVRDNDACNSPRVHALDHLVLGLRVQRARRLVHDADGRILAQRPRDLEPLPLSAAQVPPAVQQPVPESAFSHHDVVIDFRIPRRQRHLEVLDARVPHLDVVADGILEQRDLLVDDAHAPGEYVPVDLPHRHPAEGDLPAPRLVKPGDQLRQRALSAPGPPDEGDLLPGLHVHVEVDDLGFPEPAVPEGHVLHLDFPAQLLVFLFLLPRVEARVLLVAHHVVDPLHLRDHLLHALPGADQARCRAHEAAQEALEGHHAAGCEFPADHESDADPEHRQVRHAADHRRDAPHHRIQPHVADVLAVDARLVSGPPPEETVLRAAALDGLDHADAAQRGAAHLGGVPLLHPRDVDPLGRNDLAHADVDQDGSDADQAQHPAVPDHDHEIEDHHPCLQRQRREGLHQRQRDAGVGRLPVGDVGAQPLREELHRQPQHLPQVAGVPVGGHLSLDPQAVYRPDPADNDLDHAHRDEDSEEGHQPFRIPSRQQPVQEGLAEHRGDEVDQRRNRRRQDHENRRRPRALQPFLRVAENALLLPAGHKFLPGLEGHADPREFPVEFFPFNGHAAPRRVVDHGPLALESAQHDEVVEPPVDDAREGTLLEQVLRLHAPGVRLHAVVPRCHHDVLCAAPVHAHAAVDPRLLQRNPFLVVVHDHRQARRPAFQGLHLHDHRHLRDALLDRRRRLLLYHHPNLSIC